MRLNKGKDKFNVMDFIPLQEYEVLTRVPFSTERERNTENNDGVLTVDELTKKVIIKYYNKELVLVAENQEIVFKERSK